MFSTADTIVAIATPPGRGALGIVRLSGPDAESIAQQLARRTARWTPRHATFTRLALTASDGVGDEVVVTFYPTPHSSTGDDVIEIGAHGSPVVLESILRAAMSAGARLAEPGEFSLRGFLNQKRDLVQTEAIADLIAAVTPLQARAAFDQLQGTLTGAIAAIEASMLDLIARLEASLDFPEEGYHFVSADALSATLGGLEDRIAALLADAARGRLIREGAVVTLVGAPNAGKSSLFNALLNTNRAIVTPVPGTTRDVLTERVDLAGLPIALVDTAGLRETTDLVEVEGVRRAEGTLAVADLALVVLDRSRTLEAEDARALEVTANSARLLVINKIDLEAAWHAASLPGDADAIEVSVRTGEGLTDLVRRMATRLAGGESLRDAPAITNVRHAELLTQSREALVRARLALEASQGRLPEEFLLVDLQEAHARLQEVTGQRTSEDILRHIFATFCIGK